MVERSHMVSLSRVGAVSLRWECARVPGYWQAVDVAEAERAEEEMLGESVAADRSCLALS